MSASLLFFCTSALADWIITGRLRGKADMFPQNSDVVSCEIVVKCCNPIYSRAICWRGISPNSDVAACRMTLRGGCR